MEHRAAASAGGMRVLVVDDHAAFRTMVSNWLGLLSGVTCVDAAASGPEALSAMERAAPDVVVTDLNMPAMDGFELTRRIKSRRDPPPVVIMTSCKEAGFESLAAAAHADCALDKHDLLEGLPRFLRERFGVGED
jgi:CheY-like chemotaxis protein